jgi:hypothetical protein
MARSVRDDLGEVAWMRLAQAECSTAVMPQPELGLTTYHIVT